jgi:hypothetical protein
MPTINLEKLHSLRVETYRLLPNRQVTGPKGALEFVNERGFTFFWPIKGIPLPSLWVSVAGDRPVPNDHDDPGQVTWGWKDDALDKKIWYYGKILRRKATFISLEAAPYFYALSENYGSPEEDYLLAYREGRLTQAARQIFEVLLDKGSMDTLTLRKEARLLNEKESAFTRALEDLQKDFKILPIGVAEVGAWKYAFRYEITSRYMPELPEQSRMIGEAQARQKLVKLYFDSVGAATVQDVTKLFGWPQDLVRRTLAKLGQAGTLLEGLSHPQLKGEWTALPEVVD